MRYVSPKAIIEAGSFIGRNVTILGACHIHSGVVIEDNCIIGKPSRLQLAKLPDKLKNAPTLINDYTVYDDLVDTPTIIGEGSLIHSGTLVYSGCKLGANVLCEDNVTVRWDTQIGDHAKLMVRAFVGAYVSIGHHSSVVGICPNYVVIGNYAATYGDLIHDHIRFGTGAYSRDYNPYTIGPTISPSPVLEDYSTIAYKAIVIGGVRIGTRSYITPTSMVTKDVPPDTIVKGYNEHYPIAEWQGTLKNLYLATFDEQGNPRINTTS